MMTIGINYVFKVITLDDVKIKLQIWDTAGQDKYKTITQNYYRNSQGVLIVFSIDSRESFYSVRKCTIMKEIGLKIFHKQWQNQRRWSLWAIKRICKVKERSALKKLMNFPTDSDLNIWNAALKAVIQLKKSFKNWLEWWRRRSLMWPQLK